MSKKLSFANISEKQQTLATEFFNIFIVKSRFYENHQSFFVLIRECFAAEDVEQMSNLHLHEMKEFLIRYATSYNP
jgi:hypothetical protein